MVSLTLTIFGKEVPIRNENVWYHFYIAADLQATRTVTLLAAPTTAAPAAAPLATTLRNEITLRGSVDSVTEFFGYAINKWVHDMRRYLFWLR